MITARVALFLVLCSSAAAQRLQVDLVKEGIVAKRLEAGLVASKQRQTAIRELFQNAGCEAEEQPVDRHHANVVCTLPGESDQQIVVAGHLDFIVAGKGIVDDWTGAALLPSLYEAMKTRKHRQTFVFVAFNQEEDGLIGSRKFVKNLSKDERQKVVAMVNLECLGLGPSAIWVSRANPALLRSMELVSQSLRLPLTGVNVEHVGDDDTHPFLDARIPVITVHSITQSTLPILHTAKDNPSAVDLAQYFQSYRLIAFYLEYLGQGNAPPR